MRGLIIAITITTSARGVAAEPTDLAFDMMWGGATVGGALSSEWSGGFGSRPGFALRHGAWGLGAHFVLDQLDSTNTLRDGAELVSLGANADVRLYPLRGLFAPYVLAGAHAERVVGDATVVRSCHQTRTCIAGTWTETPSYDGRGLEIGAGLELSGRAEGMYFGFRVEATLSSSTFALPDGPAEGSIFFLGAGFSYGGSVGD
ncbi:MAG TPA: hypothetical protein VL463_07910 [Kofleriaceae bacterium]|nr:hypothetical protein [Kofleriaceae bacterium]